MVTIRAASLFLALLSSLVGASTADEAPRTKELKGRIQGRFTAADTGKPVAGAKVRVLIQGAAGKGPFVDAVSDADGRYALDVPIGHCNVWGVRATAGYYTQDSKTYGAIVTTTTEPQVVRDFVLQPGMPWRLELHGVKASADKGLQFTAAPDQEIARSGQVIYVSGDADGKAVLSIPAAGGRYRFACQLPAGRHENLLATLDIDKDFDPRLVKGNPEPLKDGKAARLRDTEGHAAVVEGALVAVDAGQAVLCFQAQPIPTAEAIVFRGSVEDEAGKPIAGAKFTAAFASGRGGAMSQWQATTDAKGKLEMKDVLLPASYFAPDRRVSMVVIKSGFNGLQTGEFNLLDIKRAGSGDFGTVVLKPGRTLRGKVVDENGQPVHGALITNMTNYFLYSHLQCRTDAEGRFMMPDLGYGNQKIAAQYGERHGEMQFEFDAKSGEYTITVAR